MISPVATSGRVGPAAVRQPAPVTNDPPVRGWYWPPGTNLEDSLLLTQPQDRTTRAGQASYYERRDQRNREHLVRYHQNALARLGVEVILITPGDGAPPPPTPDNPGQAA